MKTILTVITLFLSFGVFGQSVTITPTGDTTSNLPMKVFSGTSQQVLNLRNNNLYGTGLNLSNNEGYSRGGLIGTDNNLTLSHPGGSILLMNNYTPEQFVKLHSNGNFAVGNLEIPTAGLHVKEYSRLGEDAPAIKVKKFTGTTPPNQGFCTTVPLGSISHDKVLDYNVLVNYGTGLTAYVPEEYSLNPNYRFSTYMSSSGIYVCLQSGNSSNLVSKSFKVLVTYEE